MLLFPFLKDEARFPPVGSQLLAHAARCRASFLLVPSAIKTLNAARQGLNREAKQDPAKISKASNKSLAGPPGKVPWVGIRIGMSGGGTLTFRSGPGDGKTLAGLFARARLEFLMS